MNEYAMTDEETISRIADVCPRAMSAYFVVLSYAAQNSEDCKISREKITTQHCMSWTKFKNDLRALSRLFILFFVDKGDSVEVSLAGSDL